MKHLVFDTETTDLIQNTARTLNKQPRMFEWYSILWDDVTDEEHVYHALMNPVFLITKTAIAITGVTNSMVENLPPFAAFGGSILEQIDNAERVVAHSLIYDKSITDFEFQRLGMHVIWPHGVCTVESTEHLVGHRLKLGDLYEHLFGERFTGAHRAEQDAKALLRIYKELIARGEI